MVKISDSIITYIKELTLVESNLGEHFVRAQDYFVRFLPCFIRVYACGLRTHFVLLVTEDYFIG